MILFAYLDFAVFIIANLANLLLALMFFFRGGGKPKIGSTIGWIAVVLGIPLLVIAILKCLLGTAVVDLRPAGAAGTL